MIEKHIIAELEKKLEEEKDRLERELSEIATKNPNVKGGWDAIYPVSDDDRSGSSGSLEEMSNEIEEYHERLSEEDALEKRLAEVTAALSRIDTGTYGVCSVCGIDIPLERLMANPAAATDIQHASQ